MIEGSKGCFAGWALVETPHGRVAIKDIKVGQEVVCFDEAGRLTTGVVTKRIEHPSDELFRLMYWGGGEVAITKAHWVLNQFGTFAPVSSLRDEDAVVDANGHLRPFLGLESIGHQKVYNLHVDPHKTFICGGIRVHNGGTGLGAFKEFIEGEKGGKGGGGSVYTPKEAQNTLSSKSVARVIDLISEGECLGLVNGAKSIYFDDVPLQNADDSYNFEGVTWHERSGTPEQDVIPGFDDVEAEVTVDQQVKYTAPVLFTVYNGNVDALRIKIRVPGLYEQKTNGDLVGYSVEFKIEVSANGGPFTLASQPKIEGKTVSNYEEEHRIQLSGGSPYTIRVSRLTAESTSAAKVDAIYVGSYTEITEAKMIYPNSALMGYEVDSQLFGGSVPKRSVDWYGLIINVPSNYNPATRAYTGIWDGTFQLAWSDNPAWVLYDILTHPRYGLGEWIDSSLVDKWQLYQIAQYCDELVDDGFGGQEPRFTFNAVINTRVQAYALVNSIVSCFRGMAYWSAGTITATMDAPADISRLVTPADVVGDFQYSGSGTKARHSVALVSWNDPDDNYRLAVETYEDPEQVDKFGWNPKSVIAYGCTSRGQAHRYGKWIIDSEKYSDETVMYTAGYDHADTKPGDIIAIADPARQGMRAGGRVLEIIDSTHIKVDSPYNTVSGDEILLTMADDTISTIGLVSGTSGQILTLSSALSGDVVNGAMYIVQNSSNLVPEQWRVITNTETDKHLFQITALKHDSTKYARVEQDIVIEPKPTSKLPTGALVPPTNLTITESLYRVNNSTKTRVSISWTPSTDPRVGLYRVDVKSPSSSASYNLSIGQNCQAEILDAENGLWSIDVYSVSNSAEAGNFSSRVTTTYDVQGKLLPPSNVQNLTATRSYTGITLTWDNNADLDLTGYDVRVGNTFETGEVVVENYIGNSIFVEVKSADEKLYHVKARDELGILSNIAATVSAQILTLSAPTNFHAYQVGSHILLTWDSISVLEKLKYEIREGSSFESGRFVGITETPTLQFPYSVNSSVELQFHIKAFLKFPDNTTSYSPSASTSLMKHPVLNGNVVFSQSEDPAWSGTKTHCEVTGANELTMTNGYTEAYYDFTVNLGTERFGRLWIEAFVGVLSTDPLEISEATMEIAVATFPITPTSTVQPTIELWLCDSGGVPVKPFVESDYKFTTQKFRVILKKEPTDTFKPALTGLNVYMSVPDFML